MGLLLNVYGKHENKEKGCFIDCFPSEFPRYKRAVLSEVALWL